MGKNNSLKTVIADLAKKSAEASHVEVSDYIGDDGLIYCGNCHTPKQARTELLGRIYITACVCKCRDEKITAEREAHMKELKAEQAREKAFDGNRKLMSMTFENDSGDNPNLTNAMRRYVDNFGVLRAYGKGLLLYGLSGRGKTYAACEVLNALCDVGYSCHYVKMSDAVRNINNFRTDSHYIDNLCYCDVLLLDDFGTSEDSRTLDAVCDIIDRCERNGVPLIVTTNYNIEQIKSPANIECARSYNRILNICHPILVEGKDRRRAASGKSYYEMQNILGM